MSGRPLRFLGAAAIGWIGWRAAMLWPQPVLPLPPVFPPPAFADTPSGIVSPGRRYIVAAFPPAPPPAARATNALAVKPYPGLGRHLPDPYRIALAMTGLVSFGPAEPVGEGQSMPPPGLPAAISLPSRWSGSAWMVLRGGGSPSSSLPGGQLGGGQAGLRIAYALGKSRRVAIVSRVTSPIDGPGREISLGMEWQPTRLPVRLVVEHRTAIDGGRGGPAAGVIGGFGPAALPAGFTLESYAQAGAVRRARTEPFVDGAVRLARPVASIGHARLDLGLGLSGGAQRDAARLDIGPSLGLRIPLAGRSARLSLDWRQRIAGEARPGSGVAFTLGSDF